MENYASYTFYTQSYKGSLSEALFNRLIVKASVEIRSQINREITNEVLAELNSEEQFLLHYTACQLCDFINKNGAVETKSNASSISIDGVSISGGGDSDSYENEKSKILKNLPQKLIRYI